MRFSLKWALAAMAYVALAAAALAQPTRAITLSLWGTTLLTILYAIVVALRSRRRVQLSSIGFVGTAIVFLIFLYGLLFRPPWYDFYLSEDYERIAQLQQMRLTFEESIKSQWGESLDPSGARDLQILQNLRQSAESQLNLLGVYADVTVRSPFARRQQYEAANAIGTMLAGLVGCGLGALAYGLGETKASAETACAVLKQRRACHGESSHIARGWHIGHLVLHSADRAR